MMKRGEVKVAKGAGSKTSASHRFDSLVAEAEQLTDAFELDRAALQYEKALEIREDDVGVLDALGEIYFQLGDMERACPLFARSVELEPDGSYAKHMYLGQLYEGAEAAACFVKGIALLERSLAEPVAETAAMATAGGPEHARLRRALSNACCSLAELYMTDLCDEEGAEVACDAYANRAVATDGGNAEALRVLADLRCCQQRAADAKPLLLRAVELMEALYPADDDELDDGAADVVEDSVATATVATASAATAAAACGGADDPLSQLPPYAARLRAAQVALELELYDAASTLLARLLNEDDSNMEVWFLLGDAYLGAGDAASAADVLRSGGALLDAAISRKARVKVAAVGGSRFKKQQRATKKKGAAVEAVEEGGLMAYSLSDLELQRTQLRKLLAVADARIAESSAAQGQVSMAIEDK